MNKKELNKILENHKHWLERDCDGWKEMRANLRGANLRKADLRGAVLYGADLRKADLREAVLYGAILRKADLREADLYGANLREAILREADLEEADLLGAILCGADLREADLYGVDLRKADPRGAVLYGANLREAILREVVLYGADLRKADLRKADLCGADLREADLYGANLREVNLGGIESQVIAYTNRCPQEGEFVGYKKCGDRIVKLKILEDSKRSNATTEKCRCDKAEVLGIYDFEHNLLDTKIVSSNYDVSFTYKVGKVVSVDNFDENRWNECAPGIHFFLTFEMAVNY